MKKFTALLIAASIVLPATSANAKSNDQKRTQVTYQVSKDTRGHNATRAGTKAVKSVKVAKATRVATPRFSQGQRFDRKRAVSYQVVDHRVNRVKLRAAPRGYNWVRSGRDVYLVRTSNGIIASVVTGIFR